MIIPKIIADIPNKPNAKSNKNIFVRLIFDQSALLTKNDTPALTAEETTITA